MLIVKHEADAPDNGREADVLDTGQVVQNNVGLGLGGHAVPRSNEDSIEEIMCNDIDQDRRRSCGDSKRDKVFYKILSLNRRYTSLLIEMRALSANITCQVRPTSALDRFSKDFEDQN